MCDAGYRGRVLLLMRKAVCSACQSYENRKKVNYKVRFEELRPFAINTVV